MAACFTVSIRRRSLHDRILGDGVLLDLAIPESRYVTSYLQLWGVIADGDALRALLSA